MERKLINEALNEIFSSVDLIIATTKKGQASKMAKELGVKLNRMGVSPDEAEVLLDFVNDRLKHDAEDTDEIELFVIDGAELDGAENEE